MSKIVLTSLNNDLLKLIKKHKKGVHQCELAEQVGLTSAGVAHHVARLVKAKKVKYDKKTHVLTAI